MRDAFDSRVFTIKELIETIGRGFRIETRHSPDELVDEDRKGRLQASPWSGLQRSSRPAGGMEVAGLHLRKSGTNRNKVVLWRVQGQNVIAE